MLHLELHPNTSKEDENPNHPRDQTRRSPGRSKSHHNSDQRTRNTNDNELPGGRMKSSSSLTQMTSGVSRMRQAQCEDMIPIVTYDGAEDTNATANTHAHREVKVIVHRTSSSSSSTTSSVRSVGQRMTAARGKHVRSRDHFHHRRRHQTSEHSESETRSPGQSPSSCTVERRSDREASIQLQVIDIAKDDATTSEPCCETSQETIKQGGSLADMFDS